MFWSKPKKTWIKKVKPTAIFQEEALRQARLASRGGGGGGADSSSDAAAAGFSVSAVNPDANALSVNYLYMALFILVVGIIMGKVIF